MTVHKAKTPGCEKQTWMGGKKKKKQKTAGVIGNVPIMTVINNLNTSPSATHQSLKKLENVLYVCPPLPLTCLAPGIFGAIWWYAVIKE